MTSRSRGRGDGDLLGFGSSQGEPYLENDYMAKTKKMD
jgi:hypothetical protein